MNTETEVDRTLDVTGENCPIPVVRTKQAADELDDGEVLAVIATDPGSVPDIAGWASVTAGFEVVDQRESEEADGTVYTHYVRRTE